MAVSYECEQCNSPRVQYLLVRAVFLRNEGLSRDYHPWCQSQGRMAGLRTSHWSARASWTDEAPRRTCLLTKRHGVLK
jgi:hypothetical protein